MAAVLRSSVGHFGAEAKKTAEKQTRANNTSIYLNVSDISSLFCCFLNVLNLLLFGSSSEREMAATDLHILDTFQGHFHEK